MVNLLRLNTESVFCVGDIHGDFESIIGWIKRYDLTNSTLIFCGDCGFGFNKVEYYKQIINKINKECKKRNVYCLFGRGNHDDPSYFNGKSFKNGFIRTLNDYTVIETYSIEDEGCILTPNKTILWVGGATSIDRMYRLAKMEQNAREYMHWHFNVPYEEALKRCPQLYWKDEQPIYDEEKLNEINESGIKVEYVCTHTCPSFCEPTGKNEIQPWLIKDENLATDLDYERHVMDNVHLFLKNNNHPLKAWYYGHYHYHKFYVIDNIKFYLLDMGHYGGFDMIEMI